jgi:predicted AlkP superfamily phosphohydrolase/phosphomutase
MRRVRAFWNILSEWDRTVGVIGWWATWPAEEVRGYVVSDRMAYTRMEAAIQDEEGKPREAWPPELVEELRPLVRLPGEITAQEVLGFARITEADAERLVRGASYRHGEFLTELKYVHQADRSTADMAKHMLRERPTDVLAVGFYGVDAMSHLTWHFMEPERFPSYDVDPGSVERYGGIIGRYYEFVDGLVGELIAAAPPDANVIVFSDHGFGPTGFLPWSGGPGRITPGAPLAPDGVLILAGPSIRPKATLQAAHVLDVAPTLLALQGLPRASDMPGRVLDEALLPSVAPPVIATYETSPLRREGETLAADPAADHDLMEKLRALGYL